MIIKNFKSARDILGNNIAYFRIKNNWTQEQFAERLESKVNYISYLENGHRNVRIDMIEKIAKTFDITLEQLFIERTTIDCHHVNRQ